MRFEPDEEEPTTFPLKRAYRFAEEHGLSAEATVIREMRVENWTKSYTSSIRRGRIIELFKSRGILAEFIDKLWLVGSTTACATKLRRLLKIAEQYDRECGAPQHTPPCESESAPSQRIAANVPRKSLVQSTPLDKPSGRACDSNPCQLLASLAQRILTASTDLAALRGAYAEGIHTIMDSPLWSPNAPLGLRVPWRQAAMAAKHLGFLEAFQSPGIYIFGNSDLAHIYVGKADKGTQTLGSRLWNRYVCCKNSQCQLAADYHRDGSFSTETLEWLKVNGKDTRKKHAVEFAKRGIEGIWFTLLPIPDRGKVDAIEDALIPIANDWNRLHGHQPMLNKQRT